jgi:hypothetical protein
LKDPSVFCKLVGRLLGNDVGESDVAAQDSIAVATTVLDQAKKLGVDTQLNAVDLISENPHAALLFAAQVFDATTGLRLPVTAETAAFTAYVNSALANNASVSCCVPIDITSNDLYAVAARGRVFAGLLNDVGSSVLDVNTFSADRSRDEKIAAIQTVVNAVRDTFGPRFLTVDIDPAAVVDGR